MKTHNSLDDVDVRVFNAPNTQCLIEGKNERLNRAIMLMKSYAGLVVLDLANGYEADEIWVRNLRAARSIVDGMLTMRGLKTLASYYLG